MTRLRKYRNTLRGRVLRRDGLSECVTDWTANDRVPQRDYECRGGRCSSTGPVKRRKPKRACREHRGALAEAPSDASRVRPWTPSGGRSMVAFSVGGCLLLLCLRLRLKPLALSSP